MTDVTQLMRRSLRESLAGKPKKLLKADLKRLFAGTLISSRGGVQFLSADTPLNELEWTNSRFATRLAATAGQL
jgi:hypothetical protein